MNNTNFEIKLLDLHWINNVDEQIDLCAHGHVFVTIGNEIICNEKSLDITVSATALYLLRSLKDNYKKDDYGSQLLPCCGFYTILDQTGKVVILGCPNGIDWTITHKTENIIEHISESGYVARIEMQKYKKMVFDFVDSVKQFYENSKPKIIPTDEFERGSYLELWEEWTNLRNNWK